MKPSDVGLSKSVSEPVQLVRFSEQAQAADVVDAPSAQPADIISLPDAWVRLDALSVRLDAANPLKGAADALADLSSRLEAAKPPAPEAVDAVEDLSLRLELAAPAKVVTMTDDVPGFEQGRVDEPAPVVGNGGCSDEAPAIVVDLGYLRPSDGVWVAPGEGWADDQFFLFRGIVQARQRAYGPSGCPPHILAQIMGLGGAA
jgi:hypothetical protein